MGGPRVMFLHGLEGWPGTEKHRLIEKAIGRKNVQAPNLNTRQTIIFFTIFFIFFVSLFIISSVIAFVKAPVWVGIIIVFVAIILVIVMYVVAGRGATHFMLKRAVTIGEAKFKEFRPNVIVASSFGAVAALQMDIPKCPMLLFAPAQDQYTRYMKIKQVFTLGEYPYVTIVHGSNDKTVPLNDSIRLIETCEVGRCRLEVVEDNHSLKTLTKNDVKKWIEEVYDYGRKEVFAMARDGNKHVDPSLFDEEEQTPTSTPSASGPETGNSQNIQ